MLWPGAQQQPSGNGLRLLRELPVHFAIDYRGWTPIPLPLVPPPVPPCSFLLTLSQNDSSLDCRTASSILPYRTAHADTYHTCAQFRTHRCYINNLDQIRYQTTHRALHCFQQGIVPCAPRLFSHAHTHTYHHSIFPYTSSAPKMQ